MVGYKDSGGLDWTVTPRYVYTLVSANDGICDTVAENDKDENTCPRCGGQTSPDTACRCGLVTCKLCKKTVESTNARWHDTGYVGECCWDKLDRVDKLVSDVSRR
jgi:hypothetical protein